jgi:hypothetical protein
MAGSKAEHDLEMKLQVNHIKLEGHEVPVRHSSSNGEGNYCVSVLMVTDHFVLLYTYV